MHDDKHKHAHIIFFVDMFFMALIQFTISSISGVSVMLIKFMVDTQTKLDYVAQEIINSLYKSVLIAGIIGLYFFFKYGFVEAIVSVVTNLLIIHLIYNDLQNEVMADVKKNGLKLPKYFDDNLLLNVFT
jgi:hypothetical protein